jgi:antitoxin (DNA-binding transcriptional repressor) of toxin-antitoxin stability system
MSYRVGIRELRQNASRLLKDVAAGATIEVTDHGHPVADHLIERAGPQRHDPCDGRATPAREDLLDLALELALPAGERAPSAPALAELRADER